MNAVDTNVLIYACDSRDPVRQDTALGLIGSMRDGVLVWQVACEFIAASRKLAPQGLTPSAAWDRLSEFMQLFTLVMPSRPTLDRARLLHTNSGVAFWDATILAACADVGVTRLYSEDVPGNANVGVEVVNPFTHG